MKHLLIVAMMFAGAAQAADSSVSLPTTSASSSESSQLKDAQDTTTKDAIGLKKFEETHVITDAKLKADAGSLTVISLKATAAYYGPPVDDFRNKDQPNPDSVVSATKTAISGSLGARYRFDPNTTTSLGAGVKDNYPFHSGQKMTMSNPYVSYDKSFRLGTMQVVASPGLTLVTEEAYRNVGERWGISSRINLVQPLGDSSFSVGADNTLSYYFFDREFDRGTPASKGVKARKGDGAVQRVSLSFAPNVKYNITKNLSAITSWGFTFYNPRDQDSRFEYRTRTVNQRIGVGYAITRDIYINPYIQFYPTQFKWSTATANISTSFSVL